MSKHIQVLFSADHPSDNGRWSSVDDVVMGGISSGTYQFDDHGRCVFSGKVSIQNGGGFSSIKLNTGKVSVDDSASVKLVVRGDGKRYQFRIKKNASDPHAYIHYFLTNGEWQEFIFKLRDLHPTYKGRKLDIPNLNARQIEGISFLIANKKTEPFRLEIEQISLMW